MQERIGEAIVTVVRWILDIPDVILASPVLSLLAVLALLAALAGASRLYRWLTVLDARDEQRRRDALPDGARHEDV